MKRIIPLTFFLCTIIFSGIVYSQNIEWVAVPSGSFTYGENDEIRSIQSDYEIMKYEVTNAQFLTYLNTALASNDIIVASDGVFGFYDGDSLWSAGSYEFYDIDDSENHIIWNGSDFEITLGFEDHPVSEVTWFGANAYAMYNDFRLPTEEEWEKAARGNTGFNYPWGESIDGTNANFRDSGDPFDNDTNPVGYFDGSNQNGYQTTDSPSPFGAYDMAGNVWEWTDSYFDNTTSAKVARGGSWTNPTISLQTWWRVISYPYESDNFIGFRCIKETISSIESINFQPIKFSLFQNYPNPFNPSTKIRYSIPTESVVKLTVYNTIGDQVAVLVNQSQSAGTYEVNFSAIGGYASGGNALSLASGIYFYKLQANNFIETKKMILIK